MSSNQIREGNAWADWLAIIGFFVVLIQKQKRKKTALLMYCSSLLLYTGCNNELKGSSSQSSLNQKVRYWKIVVSENGSPVAQSQIQKYSIKK